MVTRHRVLPGWKEPVWPPEDHVGLARVRAATTLPIASGENAAGVHDLAAMLRAGSIDICQTSVTKIGGIEVVARRRSWHACMTSITCRTVSTLDRASWRHFTSLRPSRRSSPSSCSSATYKPVRITTRCALARVDCQCRTGQGWDSIRTWRYSIATDSAPGRDRKLTAANRAPGEYETYQWLSCFLSGLTLSLVAKLSHQPVICG